MKKIIRLTEQDLQRIVKESVKKILKEDVYNDVPWSKEDTPEGRDMDWELYQSNPYGDLGAENMNIKDRKGELGMAALSDEPALKARGRNGATTLGKHFDAMDRHNMRRRKSGMVGSGDFSLHKNV